MINPQEFTEYLRALAIAHHFEPIALGTVDGHEILALRRSPSQPSPRSSYRLYLSSGVHGDEPAGPLAIQQLISRDLIPDDADVTICPLINPIGTQIGTRESKHNIDLNRDFRDPQSPETKLVVEFLETLPPFDLSICLHEDWESTGFYLYAIDFSEASSRSILAAVERVGPIDFSTDIDGHPADKGLIAVPVGSTIDDRLDWPEAFYLYSKAPHPHVTSESPSSLPLPQRIEMQIAAVTESIKAFQRDTRNR